VSVGASEVKALRERTGAAMMECKRALEEAGGDVDQAMQRLRVRGQAQAAKRSERVATEGTVQSYIHSNARIGVLVEVDCETDFVARNEDFVAFARDLALHVAAAAPQYVAESDVPDEAREAERRIAAEQSANVPERARERAVEGRLGKWLEEVVLLRQAHVNADKHEGRTIEELRAQLAAKTGENVVIRRFERFAVGS
jgi:elongation factor Ts